MKIINCFILSLLFIHCFVISSSQNIIKTNGIYRIHSLLNNNYLGIDSNDNILLLNKNSYFSLIQFELNTNNYLIESKYKKKFIGIDKSNSILAYDKQENIKNPKIIWEIMNIKKNIFLIKNIYNNKYLEANNIKLQCTNELNYPIEKINKFNKVKNNFKFRLIKLYENAEITSKYKKYINKEPIDILIKYIDLTDRKLNREGIQQIYKDFENEELRYSLRSILKNIPWIRKIFILMPNEKVKYLKLYEEINDKIIYIKDKDLLGFDSANIFSFTFNLYKLENFGISKNFIYIEDDFFIGKSLKKYDFFYYDEKEKKVLPFLLPVFFKELSKTEIFAKYYTLYKIKDYIHPHSRNGWWLSIYSTDKFLFEKYEKPLINAKFTHNAISENIDDLKEIYEEIKDYDYFNETIYSKERHILTLNQPHFVNMYQLNIKQKKVHCIKYNYVSIEDIKKYKFNESLFVLNTGGNHIPLKRQYKIQKKEMNKIFNFKTKYEIMKDKKNDSRCRRKVYVCQKHLPEIYAVVGVKI